ncbi:MAG: nucleotidyl transferase AbiEii/AbiGii toxin family protein [Candidatus Altimarinota bacterium]
MNIEKLKSEIRKTAALNNITVQEMWDKYFFETFLVRLSKSEFVSNFVLKGGFFLENIIGVEHRTTLDLDFSYRLNDIDEIVLRQKINSIIEIENREVKLQIKDINSIADQDKYQGFRVRIFASIGNIRKTFSIDIATGDTITPSPQRLEYKTLLPEYKIYIQSYNLETMLAEKFQTVIERNVSNTRMKDFYDIYVLMHHKDLDKDLFHDVLVNTFETRKTSIRKTDIEFILKKIKDSKLLEKSYHDYSKKTSFAKDVKYNQITDAFEKTKNMIKYQDEFHLQFKSFILIRHGEDDQNKLGGWSDSDLTDLGIAQIKQLKKEIEKRITHDQEIIVISSDLKRASDTTKLLFANDYSVIFEKDLRECNNGDLANLNKEIFNEKYPGLYFHSLKYEQKYPNGESPNDYYERIKVFMKKINDKYSSKHLIVVAHLGTYGIIKSMISGIVWSNKQKYSLGYAEYFEFV